MALFAMLSRLFYQKMPFKKKENLFLILQQVHTEDTLHISKALNTYSIAYCWSTGLKHSHTDVQEVVRSFTKAKVLCGRISVLPPPEVPGGGEKSEEVKTPAWYMKAISWNPLVFGHTI